MTFEMTQNEITQVSGGTSTIPTPPQPSPFELENLAQELAERTLWSLTRGKLPPLH
jgi:hypothetical protein